MTDQKKCLFFFFIGFGGPPKELKLLGDKKTLPWRGNAR
ncbi:unnamed protein product, partial [Linum tenue]